MNNEQLRQLVREQFQLETIAAHQEYDAVVNRDHQEAAAAHARRRQALNRAGAIMEKLQ